MNLARNRVAHLALIVVVQLASVLGGDSLLLVSQDARFVEIDLATFRINDVGNFWWLDIVEVDRIIPDQSGRAVYLVTKAWKLEGKDNPTEEDWERRGVAILDPLMKSGFGLRTFLSREGATLNYGLVTNSPWFQLALTWKDSSDDSSTVLFDANLRRVGVLPNHALNPRSCLSPGGQLLSPMVGQYQSIATADVTSGESEVRSYDSIGAADAIKSIPAHRSCTILISARPNRESAPTFYVYDMSSQSVLSEFSVAVSADFDLLVEHQLLLANITDLKPLDGGFKVEHLGVLEFYDFSGTLLHSLKLQPGGRIAGFSRDQRFAYYLAPRRLLEVDLLQREVSRTVDIPFQETNIAHVTR